MDVFFQQIRAIGIVEGAFPDSGVQFKLVHSRHRFGIDMPPQQRSQSRRSGLGIIVKHCEAPQLYKPRSCYSAASNLGLSTHGHLYTANFRAISSPRCIIRRFFPDVPLIGGSGKNLSNDYPFNRIKIDQPKQPL